MPDNTLDLSAFEGHTPGPWPQQKTGDGKRIIIGDGLSKWGTHVAEVYRDDTDRDEAEANGRLVAAAPDLLAEVLRLRALLAGPVPRGEPAEKPDAR